MSKNFKSVLVGSYGLMLAVVPALVHAQTSEKPAGPAADNAVAAQPDGFGDIIVTAQKRSEKLNKVGLTITAVTGQQLAQRQITSVQDIANAVPSLSYAKTMSGSPVFTLRGVGFNDSTLAAYPTTSVYVDEVGLPFGDLTAHSAYDLDHLEVLKGPQGTLFGQNSTGGAVNFITNKPTRKFEAGLTVSYGRFNQLNAEGYISGPLTDTLTARLAGRVETMDGWQISNSRPNDRNGRVRNYMGRLIVNFEPSDVARFALNLNGWLDRSETQAPQFVGLYVQNAGFLPPSIAAEPFSPLTPRAADWTPGLPYARNSFWQASLRGDIDITDAVTLTSITAYTHFQKRQNNDNDGLPQFNNEVTDDRGLVKSFAQEIRLSNGGDSGFRWVVGANYSHDQVEERYLNNFSDTSITLFLGQIGYPIRYSEPINTQTARNIAGFANGELDVTDKLTVKVGARYTDSKRENTLCNTDPEGPNGEIGRFFYDVLLGGAFGSYDYGKCFTVNFPVPGEAPREIGGIAPGAPGVYKETLHENNVSWRVGLDYKITPDALIYANISKGYKAGSFPILPSSTVTQLQPVTQESVLSYEAGFKISALANTLQLNGAAFYYDYRDKQLKAQYIDQVFGLLMLLTNIPKSSIKGFEIEATARPIRGLTVSSAFTYLDAKIERYIGDDTESGPVPPGTTRDFSGARIPFTPKYQIGVNADYQAPLSDAFDGFIGASVNMRSATTSSVGGRNPVGTVANVPLVYRIDGYATLDGQIGIKTADNRYRLTLWAKNLTNTYYFNNALIPYDTVARYTAMPRTFGVSLAMKFN